MRRALPDRCSDGEHRSSHPGVWNINDIYTHKDNVDICNGRLKFADEMGGVEATVVRSQAE